MSNVSEHIDEHGPKMPTIKGDSDSTFLGSLGIWYAREEVQDAQDEEPGEVDDAADVSIVPLGVGTASQLIYWARVLRANDEDFFPRDEKIGGLWISILPTVDGRVPWERGELLEAQILLLEGAIPEEALDDDDIVIKKVPDIGTLQ